MPKSILGLLNHVLIESIEESVIAVNRQEEVILINQNARNLLKIDKKESILKRKIWEILPPGSPLKFISDFTRKRPEKVTEKILPFPEERVYLLQLIPVIDPSDGKFNATLSFFKDLTPFKKIDKSIEQLIENLSRELKTPITSIKGFVETLLEGAYQDKATCLHFLKIINEETNHIARLMVNLLNISPARPQPETVNLTKIDLEKLLKKIHLAFKPVANSKNISFLLKLPEKLPFIESHENSLNQILANLIDNAIKFTGIKKRGKITLEAKAEKKHAEVIIEDTGIGMPQDELDKIFEKFYRIKNSSQEQFGGTGLGLAIVKNLTGRLRGKIKVESKLNYGSKFTLIFPVK